MKQSNVLIVHLPICLYALDHPNFIPSHCGTEGNERVDQIAKETLDQDIDLLASVHYADLKPMVNSYIQQLVQTNSTSCPAWIRPNTRDLYAPRPNGTRGMTRPPAPPVALKVEEAMISEEINAELVCPMRTPNFPPGTHGYNPKRHDLIEGVSECMISRQEAQSKFNEYREAQGSHDEVHTDGSKMNKRVRAAAVINRHFQNGEKTCCQLSKRLPDNGTIFAAEATAMSGTKCLLLFVNRFRYINNNITKDRCPIPTDTTVRLCPLKFSLQATIDHHGPSSDSGHYTASIRCKKHSIATITK